MDLLVTPEQVAARSGGRVAATDAKVMAEAASDMIRALCGWHIAPVVEEEFVIGPPFPRDLHLPTLRLLEVTSVAVDGRDVPVRAFNRYGVVACAPFCTLGDVRVKAKHGYEKTPPALVDLAALAVLRAASSPTGITRAQLGQRSVSFSLTGSQSSGSLVVLESEDAVLAPYRLPAVP